MKINLHISANIFFRHKAFLALVFVLTSVSFSFSQVKATLDTTNIKIGEEIKYSIQVEADTSAVVAFPEGQSFLPLEVIEFYPTDTSYQEQKITLIKKYGLTQFDSGRYVIPQQQVRVDQQVFFTDSLWVEVADVEVDTLKQKMFDIKPAIEVQPVKGEWTETLLWILLGLLVLGLLIYIILRQKKKIEEAKKQLPPFEEAIVALKSLDNSQYLKENRVKDYYSSLTEIVKRYLDREVDEAALESTTDELIMKLELHKDAGHLNFDKATILKLREILKRADLIKFAKMQMESGQAQLDRTEIEEIIKETHESIPEPTEEELMKDAMYQQELEKKKKKRKMAIIAASILSVVVLAYIAFSFVFGFQDVKDAVFGNYTKSLAEGDWIKSEYGSPAVTLETPEVLSREITSDDFMISDNIEDVFTFGDIQKELFIYVGSSKVSDPGQVNLEAVLEEKLVLLEENGATNMIVKDEPFTTKEGVEGIRASGEFNVKLGENKYKQDKSEYELFLFAQDGGIQEVLIVIEKQDFHAQQIKERIFKSIEIEVIQK
tara:strand:- start:105158 stop:106798 length:1641 start_codon:yes stop_codon:yes gene_type:complete